MTIWHAEVLAQAGAGRLTDDQIDTLAASLPGYPVMGHNTSTGVLAMRFQVEAKTLRAATNKAFDAAHGALAGAWPGRPPLTAVRVLAGSDLAAELGPPADIVGYTEIGEILGVSRQRAQQIATGHDNFPRPVAAPLAGTFYDRAAVLAFKSAWPRKRTGRPRRDLAGHASAPDQA